MDKPRSINRIFKSKTVLEGAGVRLQRVFGYHEIPLFDPFLLLDHFGSIQPDDYVAGFPWHPHRGIETVTYMVEGSVEHEDSLGNKGVIQSGDIQWMTAGSGIIHQEIPQAYSGTMKGFQLWVNLPSTSKMMKPRYQEIKASSIPELILPDQVKVKIIAGEINDIQGPVHQVVAQPGYFDINMPPQSTFNHFFPSTHTVIAYVHEGKAFFEKNQNQSISTNQIILFSTGDFVSITTRNEPVSLLLISGKPLREPIAWKGPIVMNTDFELEFAFREYRNGTFIKK